MAHLGIDVPIEPPTDCTTHEIISTFYLAMRGRSYIGGMTVIPLPLSVRDINDVLVAHAVSIDRELLDGCVFALDDVYLTEANSKMDKPKDS